MSSKVLFPRPHPDFRMPHTGSLISDDLEVLHVSKTEFAKRLGVTRKALYDVLDGKTGVTASMALKLEAVIGSSAEMWLGMQAQHDLWKARQALKAAKAVKAPAAKTDGAKSKRRVAV